MPRARALLGGVKLPPQARIFVARHTEAVGAALVERLRRRGYTNVLTAGPQQLDLRDKAALAAFFERELPDYVLFSSTKVDGGLLDAMCPAQWLHDNLSVAMNLIHVSYLYEVEKLLHVGHNQVPFELSPAFSETAALWSELIEEMDRSCAVVRIAATELCDSYRAQYGCDFVSAVSVGPYGPGINFDSERRYVIPAVLRDMLRAKALNLPSLTLSGAGETRCELFYIEDLADACLSLLQSHSVPGAVRLEPGESPTLRELAYTVKGVVGFAGRLDFVQPARPHVPGAPLDVRASRNKVWPACVPLEQGVQSTLDWLLGAAGPDRKTTVHD